MMGKESRRRRERSGAPLDRAWADYTRSFRETVLPALLNSGCMISIGGRLDPEALDLRAATELGLMLMLDKPLLLVIPAGETIPPALRRAAAVVLDDFDVADPADQERMSAAINQLTGAYDDS
jgi:hypothetical protein